MSKPRSAGLGSNFLVGILGILLFGGIVCALTCTRPGIDSYEEKRGAVRATLADQIRKDAHVKLNGYAWVDQKAGVVQIPIDRALELAAAELKSKKVGASDVKVEMPYPVGLAAPAATPAPAPGDKAAPAAKPGVPAPKPDAPAAKPAAPAAKPDAPAAKPAAPAAKPDAPTAKPAEPAPKPAPAAVPQPAPPAAPKAETPAPVKAPPAPGTPISSEQKSSDLKK